LPPVINRIIPAFWTHRPSYAWATNEDRAEFAKQQRALECSRLTYRAAARGGSLGLATALVGIAAYMRQRRVVVAFQTKAMLATMLGVFGLWLAAEKANERCIFRQQREMSSAKWENENMV